MKKPTFLRKNRPRKKDVPQKKWDEDFDALRKQYEGKEGKIKDEEQQPEEQPEESKSEKEE